MGSGEGQQAGRPSRSRLKAIVVGNGRCPAREHLPAGAIAEAAFVIAADGGAMCALELGLQVDGAVGDGDSLGSAGARELERRGIPFDRRPPAKDESDLELAVLDTVRRGATELVILGALDGERLEHSIANLVLLAHPGLAGIDACIVDDRTTVRLLTAGPGSQDVDGSHPASLVVEGREGDFVSLIPWADRAEGVTTDGLRYPLSDEPLPFGPSRGLSNELAQSIATIALRRGRLLVVHTPRPSAPSTS